jgi:hypothetical protein
MVYFQTKNPNLGKFLRALDRTMMIYFMYIGNILRTFGVFYVNLVHTVLICYILCSFGTYCVHLVHIVFIWYIYCVHLVHTYCVHLVNIVCIWYILFQFWYHVQRQIWQWQPLAQYETGQRKSEHMYEGRKSRHEYEERGKSPTTHACTELFCAQCESSFKISFDIL